MPAYHFEGSSDSGFHVSGLLEADDAAQARKKAQRFCGTSELVVVSETDPAWQEYLSRTSVPVGPDGAGTGRKRGRFASLWAALFGRRTPRTH